MSIAKDKADLRKLLKARRDAAALAPAFRLAEAFPDSLRPEVGSIIAAYMSMGSEINPAVLLSDLDRFSLAEGRGYGFALPRTPPKGSGLPLTFHAEPPFKTALVRSVFGILEPPADWPEVEPDLLLVPLLAFDRRGGRLGYGAGHYDRTLARLRALKPVCAIGLAYAAQEVPEVPMDAHDERLDGVLTPDGYIPCAPG